MTITTHWFGPYKAPLAVEQDEEPEIEWRRCLLCLGEFSHFDFAEHMKSHKFDEVVLSTRRIDDEAPKQPVT